MADEFSLGDIVQHTSGTGPRMTITRKASNGDEWVVSWFDGVTPREAQFPAHVLEKAPVQGTGGPVVRQRG